MSGNGEGYQDGLGDDPISREVVDIICDQYAVESTDVYRRSNLCADLGGDSLDLVNIEMEFEDFFKSPDIDQKFQTVGEAVDYVKSNVQE